MIWKTLWNWVATWGIVGSCVAMCATLLVLRVLFGWRFEIPPNIRGKYKIELHSTYNGKTVVYGEMTIKQRWFRWFKWFGSERITIHCKFENSESQSCHAFLYKEGPAPWMVWCVIASYINVPKNSAQKDRWEEHSGYMEMFDVSNKKIGKCIYCNYGRDTKGKMHLEYIAKK